jgi:biopolymer transport protein ExbD
MPLKTLQDEQPTMNLTSMIDVLFLLIIFFMVGTKFSDMERDLEIEVPKVSDAGPASDAPKAHLIGVGRDGTISLDRRPMSVSDLTVELTRMQHENPGMAVVVRGDGEGAFQNVADVLAACRKAGIQKLDVAVQVARRETRP